MPTHIQQAIDGLRDLAKVAFETWQLTGLREPLKRCNRLYAQADHMLETFKRMERLSPATSPQT